MWHVFGGGIQRVCMILYLKWHKFTEPVIKFSWPLHPLTKKLALCKKIVLNLTELVFKRKGNLYLKKCESLTLVTR